ncbi:hypothetical protein HAX54_050885 [Datura stramonium]|uniref:Uncharacterized protein n=1 Tax=Datura stramonium TaxID=4076 RepID=A0ABS8WLV9_DATST|nr:hypothetical protein [Datura stramonium]
MQMLVPDPSDSALHLHLICVPQVCTYETQEEEKDHDDDGGDVSARLKGALFEPLGIDHSYRGGAGMSDKVEADDDVEE